MSVVSGIMFFFAVAAFRFAEKKSSLLAKIAVLLFGLIVIVVGLLTFTYGGGFDELKIFSGWIFQQENLLNIGPADLSAFWILYISVLWVYIADAFPNVVRFFHSWKFFLFVVSVVLVVGLNGISEGDPIFAGVVTLALVFVLFLFPMIGVVKRYNSLPKVKKVSLTDDEVLEPETESERPLIKRKKIFVGDKSTYYNKPTPSPIPVVIDEDPVHDWSELEDDSGGGSEFRPINTQSSEEELPAFIRSSKPVMERVVIGVVIRTGSERCLDFNKEPDAFFAESVSGVANYRNRDNTRFVIYPKPNGKSNIVNPCFGVIKLADLMVENIQDLFDLPVLESTDGKDLNFFPKSFKIFKKMT